MCQWFTVFCQYFVSVQIEPIRSGQDHVISLYSILQWVVVFLLIYLSWQGPTQNYQLRYNNLGFSVNCWLFSPIKFYLFMSFLKGYLLGGLFIFVFCYHRDETCIFFSYWPCPRLACKFLIWFFSYMCGCANGQVHICLKVFFT